MCVEELAQTGNCRLGWFRESRVSYGQNGVDGESKWRDGTWQTEDRLDEWFEGGLGQQINNGGGSTTMYERQKGVESPSAYEQMIDGEEVIFGWFLRSFGAPSCSGSVTPGEQWDAVTRCDWVNSNTVVQLLRISRHQYIG